MNMPNLPRRLYDTVTSYPNTSMALAALGFFALYAVTRPEAPYCHQFQNGQPPGRQLISYIEPSVEQSMPAIAASIQKYLNSSLEEAKRFDISMLRDRKTGDIVGRIENGQDVVPFPFTKIDVQRLPDYGKMRLLLGSESEPAEFVVNVKDRFVVSPDLSSIRIGNAFVQTPKLQAIAMEIVLNGIVPDGLLVGMPVVYLNNGGEEVAGGRRVCPANIPKPRNVLSR